MALSKKASKTVPDAQAATPEEIQSAVESLTESEWYKLRRIGENLVTLLGDKAGDRRGDDLLNEVFLRLVNRKRKWDRSKVEFFYFLVGAMRSVANAWLRKKVSPTEQPVLASAMVSENADGELSDPSEEFAAIHKPPDVMLVYAEVVRDIEAVCADDQRASEVIEALREGCSPADVRELWGLSQKEYNAVMVKIRRRVAAARITDPRPESHYAQ